MKPQGGIAINYDYKGVAVESIDLEFPVGQIATAGFSLGGAGFNVDDNAGAGVAVPDLPCDVFTPVVGKNAILNLDGVLIDAQDVSINVATEITDIDSITTAGITNKLGVKKSVTGKFRVEYTGKEFFDKFKNGTIGSLSLRLRDGGVDSPFIAAIDTPRIKFTNVSRTTDGGIFYDEVEFMALSPDCKDNERTISLAFL